MSWLPDVTKSFMLGYLTMDITSRIIQWRRSLPTQRERADALLASGDYEMVDSSVTIGDTTYKGWSIWLTKEAQEEVKQIYEELYRRRLEEKGLL